MIPLSKPHHTKNWFYDHFSLLPSSKASMSGQCLALHNILSRISTSRAEMPLEFQKAPIICFHLIVFKGLTYTYTFNKKDITIREKLEPINIATPSFSNLARQGAIVLVKIQFSAPGQDTFSYPQQGRQTVCNFAERELI